LKRSKRISALALALVLCATLLSPAALAAAEDELTESISSALSQRRTVFGANLPYGAGENEVNAAFERAVGYDIETMRTVTAFSYSSSGSKLMFFVRYAEKNDNPNMYAADYDEAFRIIDRTISSHEDGVNIFIRDPDARGDVNAAQDRAIEIYNRAVSQGSDPYCSYILSGISCTVSRIIGRDDGFMLSYSMKYNETAEQSAFVRSFAEQAAKDLGLASMSDEQKVRAINGYVCSIARYSYTGDGANDHTAYGMITTGAGVCQAYSLLAHALYSSAGLSARIVTGTGIDLSSGQSEAHMWNAVRIGGRWLHVDTTWNDVFEDKNPYLMLTDEQISADHVFDAAIFNERSFDAAVSRLAKKTSDKIVMRIGDPFMTVGGKTFEVDKGRGTTPVIRSDRTLLPIRAVMESVGGSVAWTGAESRVTINYNGYAIDLWINNDVARVNGMDFRLDVPPTIENDRTMIPIRFICEMMGMGVYWDGGTSEVTVCPY